MFTLLLRHFVSQPDISDLASQTGLVSEPDRKWGEPCARTHAYTDNNTIKFRCRAEVHINSIITGTVLLLLNPKFLDKEK